MKNEMKHHPSFGQEMEQVGREAAPVLTRFFVAFWNVAMKALVAVRLMPLFRKRPWLHAILVFLVMAAAPYAGAFFLVAACVAMNKGAKPDNDFIVRLQEKQSARFMGAQSDEEEREAVQGEAMLRAYESGATMDDMKGHEAMGEVYDMQKAKGKIGGGGL